MKAMVYHDYGTPDVLKLQEMDRPTVKDSDVLVKVIASSVNWIDWHFLTGSPFMARVLAGLFKPKNQVLGIDFAGRIEAVGENTNKFQPGDEVFGSAKYGCFAEYVAVSEKEAMQKPSILSMEELAAVPGAAIPAIHALRDHGQVQPGQRTLINGASGGVGTFAVQIAKAMGAKVTAVCSARNFELVSAMGADRVIDYTCEDFAEDGQCYDLIFDAVGKRTYTDCEPALKPQGIYISTQFSPVSALQGKLISISGGKKLIPLAPAQGCKRDQLFIIELIQGGKMKPVIDRHYSLPQVPEALRYLSEGHARGKVVITL